MSGLYLIGVVALWLWLTSLVWKGVKRLRGRVGEHTTAINVFVFMIALFWFGASFWYSGGQKYYYDAQVNRLCAVDGGIKVYETVSLPPERFDQYGNVGIHNKRKMNESDEYYFVTEDEYLRKGNPVMIRTVTQILRRSDRKVLGESIRYGRGGGDLPGPWHPSTYNCPEIKEAAGKLESSIFRYGVE
ncbi:MAG: hypothetical protein ABR553_07020 [Gammaproteobacteria bacterium]